LAVIPDPCFLKLLVKIFFEKEGVCRDLYDVAFPRLGFLPLAKERLASLVFVDHPVTVSMTFGIEFSGESEFFAAEEEGALFLSFFPGQFFVERSSGIDAGVSYANLLDFLEIEEPFTVKEGVKGAYPEESVIFRCGTQ
jgi:hypothetical protein